MPAISYSKENIKNHDFKNKILHGIKIHTIRRYRKRPFKLGDTLYHFESFRTSKVNKFCTNKCLYLADFSISYSNSNNSDIDVCVNGIKLKTYVRIEKLAINDGFDWYCDFMKFFIKSGLPFKGQIIGWKEGISYGN